MSAKLPQQDSQSNTNIENVLKTFLFGGPVGGPFVTLFTPFSRKWSQNGVKILLQPRTPPELAKDSQKHRKAIHQPPKWMPDGTTNSENLCLLPNMRCAFGTIKTVVKSTFRFPESQKTPQEEYPETGVRQAPAARLTK